jgi:hypothetical protein
LATTAPARAAAVTVASVRRGVVCPGLVEDRPKADILGKKRRHELARLPTGNQPGERPAEAVEGRVNEEPGCALRALERVSGGRQHER